MTALALEVAINHSEQYEEQKKAQQRLVQARNDYELGRIAQADYITATEDCIRTIRICSPGFRN